MSVGEWLISMLIMIIPIVNIVMLFIWGFGSPDPRRNYARASLIWMAICIGLAITVLRSHDCSIFYCRWLLINISWEITLFDNVEVS